MKNLDIGEGVRIEAQGSEVMIILATESDDAAALVAKQMTAQLDSGRGMTLFIERPQDRESMN